MENNIWSTNLEKVLFLFLFLQKKDITKVLHDEAIKE